MSLLLNTLSNSLKLKVTKKLTTSESVINGGLRPGPGSVVELKGVLEPSLEIGVDGL